MSPVEALLTACTLAVCAVLLVRLCLSPARRQRFDAMARRWGSALRQRTLQLWHWRTARRVARAEAESTIRRARGDKPGEPGHGEWAGNVYTPKSFRKPRRPDQLH